MPSYNERLTANNQKIDDITTLANELPDADEINEKIDAQDTIIENLKSKLDEKAGKGGGEPNVFVQLEEPTTKKGIWLQKDTEPEHYTYDEEVFIGGEWANVGTYTNPPSFKSNSNLAIVGTDIYLFNSNTAYKYDTLTNTYTTLAVPPNSATDRQVTSVGTDIYLFGGDSNYNVLKDNYKYDTLTNTYTKMTDILNPRHCGCAVSVGTDIYLLGGNQYTGSFASSTMYKYDTLTDTWQDLGTMSIPVSSGSGFQYGAATVIGTDIYLFGSSNPYSSSASYKFARKYNTLTNTYTSLPDTPNPNGFAYGSAIAVGTDIYLFGGENNDKANNAYKLNTLTNTWTKLDNVSFEIRFNKAGFVSNKIYVFNSNSNLYAYAVESKTYEQDNLVVISQGKYSNVGYEIELYSNSKNVTAPKYAFADAWYYTLAGGLETDIPTYYGDGTQWINIKNPINNGGGE